MKSMSRNCLVFIEGMGPVTIMTILFILRACSPHLVIIGESKQGPTFIA